jgi:hypothetical protein
MLVVKPEERSHLQDVLQHRWITKSTVPQPHENNNSSSSGVVPSSEEKPVQSKEEQLLSSELEKQPAELS